MEFSIELQMLENRPEKWIKIGDELIKLNWEKIYLELWNEYNFLSSDERIIQKLNSKIIITKNRISKKKEKSPGMKNTDW